MRMAQYRLGWSAQLFEQQIYELRLTHIYIYIDIEGSIDFEIGFLESDTKIGAP
jgi:hypothetical protein